MFMTKVVRVRAIPVLLTRLYSRIAIEMTSLMVKQVILCWISIFHPRFPVRQHRVVAGVRLVFFQTPDIRCLRVMWPGFSPYREFSGTLVSVTPRYGWPFVSRSFLFIVDNGQRTRCQNPTFVGFRSQRVCRW